MTPIEHGLVAVVEDDASLRSAFWRLFVSCRYRVMTFASAEELLRCGELDQVACVVADIQLGAGASGLDLGEAILESGRKTPFVFITGSADAQARRRAAALQCVALLEKPFSAQELVEAVSRVIAPEQ